MQPGDMIRYRDRIETDPRKEDVGDRGRWGTHGIIVEIMSEPWPPSGDRKPTALYIDEDGDFILCKLEDLEVISCGL